MFRKIVTATVFLTALLLAAVETASAGWLNEYSYSGKTIDVFTLDPWTGAPVGVTPTTTPWTSGWTVPAGVSLVDVLVVAGGGAGGAAYNCGGGGGAGGLIYSTGVAVSGTITLNVGAGGTTNGASGSSSVFGAIEAIGGGGGGGAYVGLDGKSGGSGGGGASNSDPGVGGSGGAGTPSQGNAGAAGVTDWSDDGGGGGGAGAAGSRPNGGDGVSNAISGSAVWYAGGGGGAVWNGANSNNGKGGQGGGGTGGCIGWFGTARDATSGAPNTGGGGGGGDTGGDGPARIWGAGGSGIVIVAYDDLTVLKWSGGTSEWSTSTVLNWNAGTAAYQNGKNVVFDDSNTGSTTVDISKGNVAPASVTFNNSTTGVPTYTLTGSNGITGATVLIKGGDGTLIVQNVNAYTGKTTIGGGTLSINTIQDAGSATANSLGTPAVGPNSTIDLANTGTLQYTGTGHSSNRVVNLSSAGGGAMTLDASGPSGTFALTGGVTSAGTSGTSTLTLTGSGLGSESGSIANGTGTNVTAVTMNGTGTWTLSGANTYTGGTTVSNGTLQVDGSLSAGGAAVSVPSGGTLGVGASANVARDVNVSGGAVNLAGTVAGTLTVTDGTVTTTGTGSPTVTTADFSVPGTGTVTATARPLAITSALKLPGGITAALTGGTSFTAAGGNLADNSVARTLKLSGGTLSVTATAPIDLRSSAFTAVTASSTYPGYDPWQTSNWSGMTGTFPNGQASTGGQAWASNNAVTGEWIQWDLGATHTLNKMHVWTYNEGGYTNWDVKKLDIQKWNGTDWENAYTGLEWAQAPGTPDYVGFDQVFTMPITTAMIRFRNFASYGGEGVALDEVVFYGNAAALDLPDTNLEVTASSTLGLPAVPVALGNLSLAGNTLNLTTAPSVSFKNIADGSGSQLLASGIALSLASGQDSGKIVAASLKKVDDGSLDGGTLTLSGSANDIAGGVTVEKGTLVVGSAGALRTGSSLTIEAGGTVVLSSGLSAGAAGSAAAAHSAAAVPEPNMFALLAAGAAGLLAAVRRRR